MMTAVATVAAMLVVAAPASANEPNDTMATATGPLAADTPYSGALETSNDADYYVFWTNDTRQLLVSVTDTTQGNPYRDCRSCRTLVYANLYDADGNSIYNASVTARQGAPAGTFAITVNRGRYYLRITGDEDAPGTTYSFTVSAPGGLVSAECFAAQDNVSRFTKERAAAKNRLKKSRSKAKRSRIRQTIRTINGSLGQARQQEAATCP